MKKQDYIARKKGEKEFKRKLHRKLLKVKKKF